MRWLMLCIWLLVCGSVSGFVEAAEENPLIATVNGKAIHADQMQLQFYLDALPESATPAARQQLIERLIDRELIRQYLRGRQITADPAKLDQRMAVIEKLIAGRGEQVDDVLERLHLNTANVREFLALPLAWERYAETVITPSQLRAEWDAHRAELDGTRVHASQIVRTLPPSASAEDWQAAEKFLADLRQQIVDGKITFAAAAVTASQSPSGKNGGDLGEFEFRGRVDEAISRVAFETPPGEVSAPFRSRFGVHVVQTHERIPGQLSPEDARPEILARLEKDLWAKQVRQLRQAARIQIHGE